MPLMSPGEEFIFWCVVIGLGYGACLWWIVRTLKLKAEIEAENLRRAPWSLGGDNHA